MVGPYYLNNKTVGVVNYQMQETYVQSDGQQFPLHIMSIRIERFLRGSLQSFLSWMQCFLINGLQDLVQKDCQQEHPTQTQ